MRYSLLAVSLSFFVGCAHSSRPVAPVELAPADLAQRAVMDAWSISIPFEKDQDGTDLVLALLERAEASGARYVSELRVVFITQQNGHPLECSTKLVPESELDASQATPSEPETDPSSPMALKPYTFSALEFGCDAVASSRLIRQRRSLPSSVPPVQETQAAAARPSRSGNACAYSRVEHALSRYAFQEDVNYVPPITYRIQQTRPDLPLAEADAECVPASPHAPANNRIEAVIHGGEGPKATLKADRGVHPVRTYL
ncbi:hypothetical protein [Comamonas sp. JC664]|uniref:hypothetical protein n=1 Tax=Comamonas sp. JC664 TaxID=2801917 RepID=UPI00174BD11B|nr:hypothetical protein [Comamonas sp. JC664]MBL0694393.1 hypothetical protein [Comamonas sp. JC664]GHG77378.1 hypothetical protein GCM10012319_27270 [Comamonas sp. KCTC 72670]